MSFSWKCPYCGDNATIVDHNYSTKRHLFDNGNKDGQLVFKSKVIVCPNEKCKEYSIIGELAPIKHGSMVGSYDGDPIRQWQLKPNSSARSFPDYIPEVLVKDYEEACLIKNLSPKASATLSRRCLQGMIRDYWGISGSTLFNEINAIKDKVDILLWNSIDSIRTIGNIGAHMEKDIDKIIDVDPDEAQLLIDLVELLFGEWYITRYNREEKLKAIKLIAEDKKELKKD